MEVCVFTFNEACCGRCVWIVLYCMGISVVGICINIYLNWVGMGLGK